MKKDTKILTSNQKPTVMYVNFGWCTEEGKKIYLESIKESVIKLTEQQKKELNNLLIEKKQKNGRM